MRIVFLWNICWCTSCLLILIEYTNFRYLTMDLSHISRYTTLEQKCAHVCSKLTYGEIWDRCIVGFGLNLLPFCTFDPLSPEKRYILQEFRQPASTKTSNHYSDVIMSVMTSQITSLTIAYSTVYSGADQRKHQSSASLALWGEFIDDRWFPRTKGR